MSRTIGQMVIDQGEDFNLRVKMRNNGGYDPVDLSSASIVEFIFKKQDGDVHTASLVGGGTLPEDPEDEEDLGQPAVSIPGDIVGDVLVSLDPDITSLLKVGAGQDVLVKYVIDGVTTISRFLKALEVRSVP